MDEDRPVLVVPEHEAPVARVCWVQAHQMGVHAFSLEGRLHGVTGGVVSDM